MSDCASNWRISSSVRSLPFPIVLSAPSGAGKTTLARALVGRHASISFSVSATTRAPRVYEQDGHDYFFVDNAEFDRMIADGEMLEWAEVHGRKYGTPKRGIEEALRRGHVVVLDIDVQGARQVRAAFPNAVLVFVLPPSAEELGRRLEARASEHPAERRVRLQTALAEVEAAGEFDYVVVNDDLEHALNALENIVEVEKARVARVIDIEVMLDALRRELTGLLERNG